MKISSILICLFLIPMNVAVSQTLALNNPVSYLALGDSYTIGESVPGAQNWPHQFSNKLAEKGFQVNKTRIIAKTGWRTDQLIKAITQEDPKDFNLVSLLIGVNNQYQRKPIDEMKRDFKCLLTEAIRLAQNNNKAVFVLSIPDYAYTPFGQTRDAALISEELDQYNAWQKNYTESQGIAYIDITGISRKGLEQPSLVAEDGLHPSAKQYEEWVELIFRQLID